MPRWPYASAPSKERHPAADDYPKRTPRCWLRGLRPRLVVDQDSFRRGLGWPELQCILADDAVLGLLRQGQITKSGQVCLDFGNSRVWPICSEQCLVRDFLQSRKVIEQPFRRDTANIKVHVPVKPEQEEGRFHPNRASAVRQYDFQPGKVNADVIQVNWIGVLAGAPGNTEVHLCEP